MPEAQLRCGDTKTYALSGSWFFITTAFTYLGGNLEVLKCLTQMLVVLSHQPDLVNRNGVI